MISIYKSTSRLGESVGLDFRITQHTRDVKLMESLVDYFRCGKYYKRSETSLGNFVVVKLGDILENIVPSLDEYPLQGTKALDCADFRKVCVLVKNKAHLTPEGLEEIRKIKSGINSKRLF